MDIHIERTGKGGRYYIPMADGSQSQLTYVRTGPGHIIADHTYVPPPFRGKGFSEALVLRLFADARAAGDLITPTCWYVADEFERLSPEWDDVWQR